jgi:hypothetical protein
MKPTHKVVKAIVYTVRHHKLGWLRDDLLLDGTLDGSKEALHQKHFVDYQAQQMHIRAMQEILAPEFNSLHVMPYTNVLDLQMFPAMSKRHSELLQMYSNNEANAERIWKVALQVWKSCSSSMISRAFIHAYRIMDKKIEHYGLNHWLVDETPHCNIRRDFIDTKLEVAPRPIISIDM